MRLVFILKGIINLICYTNYYYIRQMNQTKLLFWGSNQHNLLSSSHHKSLNRPHQTNLHHDIQDISVSEKHVAFITQDGSLYSYGLNLDGRLGIAAKPDLKLFIDNAAKIKLNARAVKVKCGFSHVCVKLSNDQLYSWGLGDYGALGIGQFKSKSLPIRVLIKSRIQNFSCGAMHSGFIDYQGNIYTCGSNEYGQLGVNRPQKIATPIIVNFNHKAKQIQCGVFYTILLTTKGQVYGMGNNKYGQLGIGHKVNQCHPTIIKQLQNIVTIAAGYHSGAIDSQGNLYIWGSGSFGQLLKPKKIVLSSALDQIYIRGFYGVAVTSKRLQNKIYVWGNNTYGELGRGNFQSSKDPIQLKQLSGISLDKFACGVNFFLATTKDTNLSHIPTQESLLIMKNRFDYVSIDHSVNSNKSPLNFNSRTPKTYQIGSQTYRHLQIDHYPSKYRSPNRLESTLNNERLRSRSRQEHDAINQQIRRSRSRARNYQQLFVTLSADYQALLTRYKTLEDHLEVKNRTLAIQKQELSLIFQQQNQVTRSQNDNLKRQLLITKQKLIEAENKSSFSSFDAQNMMILKNINIELKNQNDILKNQNKNLNLRLQTAEEELRLHSTSNKKELRLIQKQSQNKKDLQVLEEQNYQLTKQIRLLKQQFKVTIKQLESSQEETAFKDVQIKSLKQKVQSYRLQLLDIDSKQSKEAQTLAKELKGLREQYKSTVRKLQQAEEQLAIKSLECKDLKQKKLVIDYKQQFQKSQKQFESAVRDFKQQKQENKSLSRKYNELQQELAIKNIDIRDIKKKKDMMQNELKQQNAILSQQLSYLSKQIKITKDQLKITLKKLDTQEDQLLSKTLQLKQIKEIKGKLSNKEVQLDTIKSQYNNLAKQMKQLRDSLKKTLKDIDSLQQSQQAKKAQIAVLTRQIKSKNDDIRHLEKKFSQTEDQYRDFKSKKQIQLSNMTKKYDSIFEEYSELKSKEKQLNQTVKQLSRTMNEKEKQINNFSNTQKKLQNEFNKTIIILQDEKQRLNKVNARLQFDKRTLEDALRQNQNKFMGLERQFQKQIGQVNKNVLTLKQVHDLNQLRADELKTIIQNDKKLKNEMMTELDLLRMQSQNLIEQKKELFRMIQELKNNREDQLKIYKDKIIQLQNEQFTYNSQYQQLQIELNYQKQYHKKCQYTIKQLTDNRDKICKQNQAYSKQQQKDKQRIKQLSFEVQKSKTLKKQIQVLNLQLQRIQNTSKSYREQIQEVLAQKQQIVKELKNDLQQKQKQVDKWQEKYDNQTGNLNREVKDWQKKYAIKHKQYNEVKREVERRLSEIDNLKDNLEKTQRKLAFKNEELQKQSKQHQKTTQQFNNLRRQYTKLRSEKQDLQNKIQELKDEKKIIQTKLYDKKKEVQKLQDQIKRHQSNEQNLRKENQISKKELQQSNWALQQSTRVNDELQRANKQFAQNEEQFNEKISHLEGKIFELEDQNKSYTPRYQVLMQRNKELDERNRQLSQMINKAIEIQAEAYKTNILKEVEINTGQIIQQIKEEQEFKSKGRRKENQNKSPSKSDIENVQLISQIKAPKIKEDPYSKFVNDKITIHKKKISDSAQKLAGILQLNGKKYQGLDMNEEHSDGKSFSRSMNMRKQEDYEKINNQMQSLNNQKQEFMQKISSFAEKLKIL